MSTNNVDNSNPCRVYVGNLDWEVTWRDLKDHMRDMGHIQRVDVVKDWDGRSRGFGFVDFSNEHDALRAITELNDTELKSRRIIVREDRNLGRKGIPTRERRIVEKLAPDGPREFGFSKVVVVGNLAPEVTWRNLKDLFRSAGAVSRADIIFDEDRVSTGVAIVEFRFGSDVNNAISQFNETFLGENIITVRPATAEDRFITGKVSGQGRRVYVGQLAWSVTWQILKDHFKNVGTVLRADVATDETRRSRGFGFVEFKLNSEAERAILELNNSELHGRFIQVRGDKEDK